MFVSSSRSLLSVYGRQFYSVALTSIATKRLKLKPPLTTSCLVLPPSRPVVLCFVCCLCVLSSVFVVCLSVFVVVFVCGCVSVAELSGGGEGPWYIHVAIFAILELCAVFGACEKEQFSFSRWYLSRMVPIQKHLSSCTLTATLTVTAFCGGSGGGGFFVTIRLCW